jgi:hypothetical protein
MQIGGVLSRFPCNCGCTYGYTVGCPDTGGGGVGNPHQFMLGVTLYQTPWLFTPTICPGATVIGPVPIPVGGDPAWASQQLAALKAQLQQAIAQIENQENVVNESLKPQTVEQVEDLQGKLRDALAELDKRKSELGKRQGSA